MKIERLILFTIFIISTCGLIYELIAGTIASYLLGDSITQFSLVIGIYLFSMGIGSFLSKFITKNLISKFIEIELLIGLIGGLSAPILFLIFNYVDFFEFYLYFIVFLIGCLVGLEIPILMIILQDKFKFNTLVSNVFTFDYIGALLASIAFPIFFVPKFGLINTSIIFGIINVIVGLIMCYIFKDLLKNNFYIKVKAFLMLIVLIITLLNADKILSFSEKGLYGENIIFAKTTKYQRLVLTHENSDYKLYLNNNLQFSSFDEYRYHEAFVHPAISLSKNIDNILILGGGDGMAAREILKYNDVKKITLVDLDSEMTNEFKTNKLFVKLNENSLNSPKVKTINKDAFIWLDKYAFKYDIIFIDFPDPSNFSLGKLYSTSFYKKVKSHLNVNGTVVIQSTSPFFAPKSFWCINTTLKDTFVNTIPYHVYLPSFGEWGFNLVFNGNEKSKIIRQVPNLKFYDFKFNNFCFFSKDMQSSDLIINRLDNQNLVTIFNQEWSKY
ncbi:polyamine aminopropyltransferase [Flavobacterium sp.]|uniref:polyamine aminopropyltransferase n=1 Tax=Flavobacterium sp. TaxID=239 RepID=UPI003751FDED